jgi:hypothetical protein
VIPKRYYSTYPGDINADENTIVLCPNHAAIADAISGTHDNRKGAVKGGVKMDHQGGDKVDHFLGSWGFALRDLRGRLQRRPATRFAGRV